MKLHQTLLKLNKEEIYQLIERAGALTDDNVQKIKKGLIECDKRFASIAEWTSEFLYAPVLLTRWPGLNNIERTREIVTVSEMEFDITQRLDDTLINFEKEYLDSPVYIIENSILIWELFFKKLAQYCMMYSHDFERNVFYPVISEWISNLRIIYNDDKLKLRNELLKNKSTEVGRRNAIIENKENTFKNFDELYDAAIKSGIVPAFTGESVSNLKRTLHNENFNIWLLKIGLWEPNNLQQYLSFLTIPMFLKYIKSTRLSKKIDSQNIPKIFDSKNVLDMPGFHPSNPDDTSISNSEGASFTMKEVAIAYFIMKIQITKENAQEILNKHTRSTSVSKLLQMRIAANKDLIKLSEDKSADSKHLKSLIRSKELMYGKKKKEFIKALDQTIIAFTRKMEDFYHS